MSTLGKGMRSFELQAGYQWQSGSSRGRSAVMAWVGGVARVREASRGSWGGGGASGRRVESIGWRSEVVR